MDSLESLKLLRVPFKANQIGSLPKPTKAQTEEVKKDYKKGIRCEVCGGWHHPKVVHLDYVGHAALTDRLLDCDINWSWNPLALTGEGLPAFDEEGGLWIKLTVCGQTRLGYGNAQPSSFKEVGSRQKECIGDALRNAAMRFGAALDLWHKGDLHDNSTVVESKDELKPAVDMEALKALEPTATAILLAMSNDDTSSVAECWRELTEDEMKLIWTAKSKGGYFTQKDKDYIRACTTPEPITTDENDIYMDLLKLTATDPVMLFSHLKITGIHADNYNEVIRVLSIKKAKIMENK